MKRIAYADAVVGTDDEVADLVLEYATQLARISQADTVHIPAVPDGGRVQRVALLLGPASQITVYEDDADFDADVTETVADLRRRIEALSTGIAASDDRGPDGLDDMDDLDGVSLPDE